MAAPALGLAGCLQVRHATDGAAGRTKRFDGHEIARGVRRAVTDAPQTSVGNIGDDAVVGAKSLVRGHLPERSISFGIPASVHRIRE